MRIFQIFQQKTTEQYCLPVDKIRQLCASCAEGTGSTVVELVLAFGYEGLVVFLEEKDGQLRLRQDWVFSDTLFLRSIIEFANHESTPWKKLLKQGAFDCAIKDMILVLAYHAMLPYEKKVFLQVVLQSMTLKKGTYHIPSAPIGASYEMMIPRSVNFSQDIAVCKHVVVSGLYEHVMGGVQTHSCDSPRYFSWVQAIRFCNELSKKQGKKPVYSYQEEDFRCLNIIQPRVELIKESDGYRLLTEAEWEVMSWQQAFSNEQHPHDCEEWVFDTYRSYVHMFTGLEPICNDPTAAFRVVRDPTKRHQRIASRRRHRIRLCCRAPGN